MQNKIIGNTSIGRRIISSCLRYLREWFGCSSTELFRRAANDARIAIFIKSRSQRTQFWNCMNATETGYLLSDLEVMNKMTMPILRRCTKYRET